MGTRSALGASTTPTTSRSTRHLGRGRYFRVDNCQRSPRDASSTAQCINAYYGGQALAVQAWPISEGIYGFCGDLAAHFASLPPSRVSAFAGNGMHVGCLELLLGWVFTHGSITCASPRKLPVRAGHRGEEERPTSDRGGNPGTGPTSSDCAKATHHTSLGFDDHKNSVTLPEDALLNRVGGDGEQPSQCLTLPPPRQHQRRT